MPHRVVFFGNCQAGGLNAAYNQYISEGEDDRSIVVNNLAPVDVRCKAFGSAEVVVAQVADMNGAVVEELRKEAPRLILFPYLSGSYLWPYTCSAHSMYLKSDLHRFQAYLPGDRFLNEQFDSGAEPEAAADAYLTLDIERAARLERLYDVTMRVQRARDEKSGIETAEFIERNLSKEPLFATAGHPRKALFIHMATQIFDKIGVSWKALLRMQLTMQRGPLDVDEVPIHPKIAAFFNLPGISDASLYSVRSFRQTFRQYAVRYMQMNFDRPVLEGLEHFRNGEHELAVAALSEGLQHSPPSPHGWRILSLALSKLGRTEESLAAARRAIDDNPDDVDSWMLLARLQLAKWLHAEAEATVRCALRLHPDNPSAHHVLSVVLEKQRRAPEAIRAMRLARELSVPSADLALHHARLAVRVGNDRDAEAACREAIASGRDPQPALELLNQILSRQNRPAEGPAIARQVA
jgi:Flp pilus assembly protein TadD